MLQVYAFGVSIVSVIVYGVAVWATYDPAIRSTKLFWLIGLITAVVGHALWSHLVQKVGDQKSVLLYSLMLDVGFTATSVLVPVVLFDLKITPGGYVGILLVAIGGILISEFGFLEART